MLQVVAKKKREDVDTIEVGKSFSGGGVDCGAVSRALEFREEVDES